MGVHFTIEGEGALLLEGLLTLANIVSVLSKPDA